MAAELGISIAEKLLEAIGTEIVIKVCEIWGYKSQLEELKETVSTIQKVLLDTEAKRELSNEEQGYIENLKDALYDADDLFDEFHTLAELKQLQPLSKSGKLFEKVRRFFSSKNQVGQAYRMSREVKEIKKRLDAIADNHKKFGFTVNYKPIIRRREETYSYVDPKEIIGREEDKEAIIDILLNHNNADEDFCFLTIVGVGGLGKTALAQLLYNDEKVKTQLFDVRLWVSVSDQDGQHFDVKKILCKILELVTHQRLDENSSMELVQTQFQHYFRGKKYFLVLDDVWNENREQWLKLKHFLLMGQGGSKIVITTRSEMTSRIIDDKHVYKLDGLSKEYSWRLFEMSAFDQGREEENYHKLVEVGKKIIEKCYNVPLAIKVVGSLVFGQDLSIWRSIEESGIAQMREGNNRIMSILKLSYHNLESSLKSCFSFCALFVKDHRIKKQMLIDMWIAHGYIIPLDGKQSIEDAAEEHLLILLRRCFFQNVVKDIYGNILFLEIHDLMHDVAQEMRRKDICLLTYNEEKVEEKVRHAYCTRNAYPKVSLCNKKIRSYICSDEQISQVTTQLKHLMCLRVLTLTGGTYVNLPNSIGKLMLLRYLDLSYSRDLEVVCDSITKLHNLQTLILQNCTNLKELPKNFVKMVKLRHLNLKDCDNLTCMPSGLTKLCSLKVLPFFVVGKKISTVEQREDELQALISLAKLKGELCIEIGENYRRAEGMNDKGRGYLKSMEYLSHVSIKFLSQYVRVNTEALLQDLEPHPNLTGLELVFYKGRTIPKWGRAVDNWETSFSRMVFIHLCYCTNLQQMPMLSKLPFLKSLRLQSLESLQHMEDAPTDTKVIELATFFPSLEVLELFSMKRLKGWWKWEQLVDDDHHIEKRFIFPRLHDVNISLCPILESFPPCLSVGQLRLKGNNDELEIKLMLTEKGDDTTGNLHDVVKLSKLTIDNVGNLKSLPKHHLTDLTVRGVRQVESQPEVGKAFQRCAASLQRLEFVSLRQLRRLSGRNASGFQHFTALESLTIDTCYPFEEEDEDEDEDNEDMMLWKSFSDNLHSLKFEFARKITTLPRGIQCLTSLQRLSLSSCYSFKVIPEWIGCLSSLQSLLIDHCKSLKSLPEAMRNLTSLQSLTLRYCSRDLIERCKAPDGEDHPKIQHIPHLFTSF